MAWWWWLIVVVVVVRVLILIEIRIIDMGTTLLLLIWHRLAAMVCIYG